MYAPPERASGATPATDEAAPARAGQPVSLARLWLALRRGRRWVAVAGVLGAVAGALVAKLVVDARWEAVAVLLWEPPELEGEGEAMSDPARELRTVADSVKVPVVLRQVREELGLETTLPKLGARIQVGASEESRVLTLTAAADSGEDAAALAEAVVDAFLEERARVRAEARRKEAEALRGQVAAARTEHEAAREVWDAFRREHRVADLPLEARLLIERLAALRAEAEAAGAEAEAEAARTERLRQLLAGETPMAVLQEQETSPDRLRLAEAERERASLLAALGEAHPEVRALGAEIATLRARVAGGAAVRASRTVGRNPHWDEGQSALRQAAAAADAASSRREALAELADASASRLQELSSLQTRAAAHLAAVTVSAEALGELEARALAAEARARAAPADVRLLAAPSAPDLPASSMRRPLAVAFPLLAMLLALVGVLLRELRGLRLRTPAEHAWWARLPVVASTRWTPRGEEADEDDATAETWCAFVGDLEELAGVGGGETLVVAADPALRSVGVALARLAPVAEGAPREEPPDASAAPRPFQVGTKRFRAWPGPERGAALRRACRDADRVLVLVPAGAFGAATVAGIAARIGRAEGVGLALVGVGPDLEELSDQVGEVEAFWAARSRRRRALHAAAPTPERQP
ncbi:MAG TPA: hypothetical protein RMH85_03670 [Polyangiaceae bacterium LLY-WYZ-15_(1-7)]|nr:hypothetical protein [Sandaracinus sp.]MBJ70387.1 hypothetical protein [Sandaracinus sp.]HJL03829.1 hypothetical protein [Polyangiaceae bacterium LLY-WYZ-15_(1-7)]HJL07565.1 hypothetical protein [Polyangiaceae bacterium LLY-WYZ-15_(1-7)]